MSQRTALLLSLLLTVIVAGTIAFNRDRLTGTRAEENIVTSGQTQIGTMTNADQEAIRQSLTREGSTAETAPRVIEVTLPADTATSLQRPAPAGDDWDDHDDDDDDHDDHDYGDDDHEDDDDD